MLDNGQSEALLNSIKQPTLILWGKQDRILDVSAADVFHDNLVNSQMILMDGIGHMPMFEAPNESAEYYRQFLSRL